MQGCSSGNSTDGSLPMSNRKTDLKKMYTAINRVQFLIQTDGLENFWVFPKTIEVINNTLVQDLVFFHKYLHQWNTYLFVKKRAYQQLIQALRHTKADIHLWKKIFPCVCFGRLGKKELGEAQVWTPPPAPKVIKDDKKTVQTLPFLLSFYKKLKEKHREGDEKATIELIKRLREVLPFGSKVFLNKDLQRYQKKQERITSLAKEQRKLRYCAGVKIGHSRKRERMAEEHFCVKQRRYLSKFRVPDRRRENSMEEALEGTEKDSESESEDEEW